MRWFVASFFALAPVLCASRVDSLQGLSLTLGASHFADALLPFEQFVKTGTLPTNATDLLPGLQVTGLLADIKHFNPFEKGEGDSVFRTLADGLRQRGTDYSATLATVLESTKSNFGAALLLGVLTPFAPDLLLTLEPSAADFSQLSPPRQVAILRAMKLVWPNMEAQVRQQPSLKPYLAGLRFSAQAKLETFLAQSDFGISHTAWEDQTMETCIELLAFDVDMAVQVLQHAATLIESAQKEGSWKGRSYVNGFNVASALLESVGKKASSLQTLALSARLCSPAQQKTFLYPSPTDAAALHGFFLQAQGLADPRGATQALLTEIKKTMGKEKRETLLFAFHALGAHLSRWHEAIVRDEAAKLAAGKGPLKQVALEMSFGLGLRHADDPSLAQLRSRIRELSSNSLLRAQFAALLCDSVRTLEGLDLLLCVEAVLPLLEQEWPTSGAIWEKFLPAFNRCPKDDSWNELAARLRQAWLHRARFQKLGNLPAWQRFSVNTATALHLLETFCRSEQVADLASFADSYRVAYRSQSGARLILARYRCANELKQVMAYASGVMPTLDDTLGVAFRNDDVAALGWLDEAISDPAVRTLARVQVAQVHDSPWQSPSLTRDQRLAAEAKRWLAETVTLKPAALKHAQDTMLDSFSAARVLAPSLLQATPIESLWQSALPANAAAFQRAQMIRRPLTLALAALANGDEQPWLRSRDWLKLHSADEALMLDVSHRLATVCLSHARDHGFMASPWLSRVLDDVCQLRAPMESDLQEVWLVRLASDCIAGKTRGGVVNGSPPPAPWLLYTLHVAKLEVGQSGADILMNALKHGVARDVFRQAEDLSYEGQMPERWSDQLLRGITVELLNADPGNPAVLLSVLNAWTGQKDLTPLLKAVRAIKPSVSGRDYKALAYITSVERESGRLSGSK